MCILSMMVHIKDPLLLLERVAHDVGGVGFLFHYLSFPLIYD